MHSARDSVAPLCRFSVLEAMESWAGPGNEAKLSVLPEDLTLQFSMTLGRSFNCKEQRTQNGALWNSFHHLTPCRLCSTHYYSAHQVV